MTLCFRQILVQFCSCHGGIILRALNDSCWVFYAADFEKFVLMTQLVHRSKKSHVQIVRFWDQFLMWASKFVFLFVSAWVKRAIF